MFEKYPNNNITTQEPPEMVTLAQKRIWALEQLFPNKSLHNIPVILKIVGKLDFDVLQRSLELLIKTHSIFRSSFVPSAEKVIQKTQIDSSIKFQILSVDLQHLKLNELIKRRDCLIVEEVERPFNFTTDLLIRFKLIKTSSNEAFLVLTIHSLIFDKASEEILIQEISEIYQNEIQRSTDHYEVIEKHYKENENDKQLHYWQKQLEEAPNSLQLPQIKNRLVEPSFSMHFHKFYLSKSFDPSDTQLLSSLMLLLYRYSGQNDVVVGIPSSQKINKIGRHENFLPIRIRFDQVETSNDLLLSVHNACQKAQENQDLPFELLVEKFCIKQVLNVHPIFQVTLTIDRKDFEINPMNASGLTIERIELPVFKSKLDLELSISYEKEGLKIGIAYSSDLFDQEFGQRFEKHFKNIMDAICNTPEFSIRRLNFLSQEEQIEILDNWNKTDIDFPLDKTIHQLFEEQVERTPEAPAVYFNDVQLTYSELNIRSNQLAHFLINQCKIRSESLIALCLERSENMLVAIQGILKAGCAYVPIDPNFPIDRIQYILDDTQSPIVITQETCLHLFDKDKSLCIDSHAIHEQLLYESTKNPNVPLKSKNLAYILYTSGTSGRPKGVMIEHQGIVNRLFWKNSVYPIQPDDKFFQKSPYTFDVSVVELFLVHWFGGSVVVAKPGGHKDPDYLRNIIESHSITMIHFVPSMLNVFLDTFSPEKKNLPSLRLVVSSGEPLQSSTVKAFYNRVKSSKLYNLYGPTEASVDVLAYDCKEVKGSEVYIGKPIANTKVYVLDENRMPLSVGAAGELYIGGVQLAREYLNHSQLTIEKFITCPFDSQQRLYNTGDLVKWMPDGNIAYLGRNDNQIKLKGYRIELDEIVGVLSGYNKIKQAVVEIKEYSGTQHLVAYCVKKLELKEEDEKDFISTWGTLFESEYASMKEADIQLNVKGWNSSYTGLPISPEEMYEWTHETVKRIEALKPRVILEIGSGSGLILFNIIDRCEGYYATDISQNVITYTDTIINQYQLKDKVVTECCMADEIPYEKFQKPYDTVVINSVIQLFPNIDYLEGVILEAIAYMGDKGQVFIGDVRDYRLLHCFHYSVLKYKNGEPTKAEVERFVRREKELLISPEYFTYLQATTPHISHIEIMPKMGLANHEMNMFRYDVILHIDKRVNQNTDQEIKKIELSDFVLVDDYFSYIESNQEDLLCMKYLNKRVLDDYTSYYGIKIDADQKLLGVNAIADEAKLRGYQIKFYLDLHNPLYIKVALFRNKMIRVNFSGQPHRLDCANNPLITSKLIENAFTQEIKEYLGTKLPEYMIPEHYIVLDALPVTSNGKLDKEALPEVDFLNSDEYVAPRNELELQVHTIWADVLGLPREKISIAYDFFRLGGNSILAIKLANQLNKNLKQNVKVSDIFTYTSIEKLVQHLKDDNQKKFSIDKGIFSSVKEQVLSFAQERLWFIQKYENGTNVYNIPMVYQLNSKINGDALKRSLLRIIERHEVLRTLIKEDHEGNGYQHILNCNEFNIKEIDVEVDQLDFELDKEINHIFDLNKEFPTRMHLYNVSDGRCLLCIIIHHIAFDGWSLDVFIKELEAYYNFYSGATPIQPNELKLQYKDFAKWQRNYLQGEKLEQQLSYWKGKLDGYEAINLVLDKPRPREINYFGSDVFFRFDSRLSGELRTLAQELNVSLYSLLLGAYYLMLRVYSHQDDLVVGTPIANRHYNDIDEMIGFFVNSLVLRYQINSDKTLDSYIKEIANEVINAQLHQDLPFEKLVAELDVAKDKSRHPLFQVMFTVQSFGGKLESSSTYHHDRTHIHESPIMEAYDRELRLFQVAYFDITTFIDDSKEELEGRFNYATSLFHRETIGQYIQTFEHILRQFVTESFHKMTVAEVTYINDMDYNIIVNGWNQTTTDYPKQMQVHTLFEHYAEQNPDTIAIISEDYTLSYGELNKKANQLAHYLIEEYNLQKEQLVGICLEDNLEILIASLGILKAGGAYVPMDPKLPDGRLQYLLEDANLSALITDSINFQRVEISKWVSLNSEKLKKHPLTNPDKDVRQNSLAQVLYTSGTTGFPKGVMIEHHNIVSLVKNTNFITIGSSDTFIQLADATFDAATLEIWGPLLNGGRLVFIKNKMELFANSQLLQRVLEKYHITVLWLTRALFDQIYTDNNKTFHSLDTLIVGGEALNKKLIEELVSSEFAPKHLINGYGPTECTTFSCTLEITKESLQSAKSVPIGKPIANKSAYVLNEEMAPLPIGAIGELHIGGSGCARGYLNNPEQTAKKFISNPFNKERDSILYKTGDLTRWLPNGTLEFIGRNDLQIKLRGYRIELEEIESVLLKHQEIKQAVVLVKEYKENTSLVAYCVKALEIDEQDTKEFVGIWESLYQSEYDALNPKDFKLNIKGWNCSYTGQPIPTQDMLEWTQETVKRIAEQNPQNILEIGSGSGLILFNIYDKCSYYIATDFSKSVIAYTNKVIESCGLEKKIETLCCPADQIPYSELEREYDTVVINSVTQYFPHLDYLESVILKAIEHMGDTGRVFIGDVRDYRLLKCFHFSVLKNKGEATTKAEVDHFVRREKELLISPEYFVYLKMQNPEIISVELLPKIGRANHEMNNYRYDVILHIDKRIFSKSTENIRKVNASDFVQVDDITSSIQSLDQEEYFLIKYPNKRIFKDYVDYHALKTDKNQQLLGINDIAELCKAKGYQVKFHLNLNSPLYLNIALYNQKEIQIEHKEQIHRQELANNPLVTSKLVENEFSNELRNYLVKELPEYMIPEHYVMMDKLPVTQNGKLNRNALPDVGFITSSEYLGPRNVMESQVQAVWANVLGLSEKNLSVKDNFFRLGGNSILAIKLANQLNKHLQHNIQVSDIFTYTTIEKLSQQLMSIDEALHQGETYVF